jgi:hypothetical protein
VDLTRDHSGTSYQPGANHHPSAVITDEEELLATILPCVPEKCRGLVEAAIKQIIANKTGRECAFPYADLRIVCTLLRALTTQFSIVAIFPLDAVQLVRRFLGAPSAFLICPTSQGQLLEHSPEVYDVINGVLLNGRSASSELWGLGTKFLDGLCDVVELWDRCSIPPPPFEHIPGSNNVERTGAAFSFTRSRTKGRVARRYVSNKEGRAECNKNFGASRGRTGGLFSFFCILHAMCLGTAIINDAEGRRDPFIAVYLYCREAPLTLAFDFACGLCEYALNREPFFWRSCRCGSCMGTGME